MAIGKRLVTLRASKGFKSQSALSRASGVPQSMISDIENDKITNPELKTLQKLATGLGITVGELTADDVEVGDSLVWFWRARLGALSPVELFRLRDADMADRIAWAVRQLLDGLSAAETSRRLGFDEADLSNIAAGRMRATSELGGLLVNRADIPENWLWNGNPGEINTYLRQILEHEDSGTYLILLARAIEHGIQPDLLQGQIDLLIRAQKR